MNAKRESGFTLPELIMAVTILGIIAATIGSVLVAAFSATAGVNGRFDASRASKQTALYWTPDVQSVETVNPVGGVCGGGVGAGAIALITFESFDHAPMTDAGPPAVDVGTSRRTTWWLDDTNPARVVRRTCAGTAAAIDDPANPIASRIADRDQRVAGVATGAAAARAQVAAQCSDDGVAFHACATPDAGRVVRITLRVPDQGAHPDPAQPGVQQFTTFEFQVAATRAVQ